MDPAEKIANPNKVYLSPSEIVEDPRLTKSEKIKALDSMEYDSNQLLVASDERLNGGEAPISIKSIHKAREALTDCKASPENARSAKTV